MSKTNSNYNNSSFKLISTKRRVITLSTITMFIFSQKNFVMVILVFKIEESSVLSFKEDNNKLF